MPMNRRPLVAIAVAGATAALIGGATIIPSAPVCAAGAQASYSQDVLPIFKGWCNDCHRPGGQGFEKSGLDLTTYDGLMKGTKYGAMIVAGDPDASNLM